MSSRSSGGRETARDIGRIGESEGDWVEGVRERTEVDERVSASEDMKS